MHCSFESSNSFLWDLQPKLLDEIQTTIYKRAVDRNYNLKMKASRFIFSEIYRKFSIMPFIARCVVPSRHFLRHCLSPSTLLTFTSTCVVSLQQDPWRRRGLGWVWGNVFFFRSRVGNFYRG
jgi:hypothetical protein